MRDRKTIRLALAEEVRAEIAKLRARLTEIGPVGFVPNIKRRDGSCLTIDQFFADADRLIARLRASA